MMVRGSSAPSVAFDVLFQFRDRFVGSSCTQRIHDPLVASDGRFPFRFLDAISKLLKEHLKHFPEGDHRS